MNLVRALLALCLIAFAGAAPAQPGGRHMEVRLVAETASALPESALTLAFTMHPQAGWHGYWRNPGDAGAEPRVQWHLPEGWTAEPLQYPMPGRLSVAGMMNYVFDRDYALVATIHVPAGAELGATFPLDARLDYLVCTDQVCVPETATVTVNVAVGAPNATAAAFQAYRRALPRPLGAEARFETVGNRLRLALPLPAAQAVAQPYVYAATQDAASASAAQSISRVGDTLVVETDAGRQAGTLQAIEGVLQIAPEIGLLFTARRGPVPPAGTPLTAPATEEAGPGLLVALLFAIVGGLILNIMPCVFPILSLKALSLSRANGSEAGARREALAYAAGVVLTCVALGGLLLALRAGGTMVGWAFQLQDPRVILLLLLLITAIALGLAGLFHLPVFAGGDDLARKGGPRGAFFTGALAAFVATPCTGPFMGAALGAALVLPAAAALAIFAGLGLGLALPFLLLGFVPALRRLLPRPGGWMATFQRILSVPMFLTALGLAWVLGQETGVNGMAIGLGSALLVGLALWWLGRGGRWLAGAVLVAALAGSLYLLPKDPPATVADAGPLGAERFSEARLAALRAARTPVFLYFTADWCLTCKVNERGAMASQAVADAFRAHGVRVMEGDWTRGDPAIGRFLESHGRSGVPLYLYYAPGQDATVLPQVLTAATLTGLGTS